MYAPWSVNESSSRERDVPVWDKEATGRAGPDPDAVRVAAGPRGRKGKGKVGSGIACY